VDDLRGALGDRVRRLREDRGWSQEVLAERADLHFTYVSQIERGARNPGLNVLGQLARAFGVTLPDLVSHLREPDRPRRLKRGRPKKVR
jgi:transcriptional regulator with XRE-family HTH domain